MDTPGIYMIKQVFPYALGLACRDINQEGLGIRLSPDQRTVIHQVRDEVLHSGGNGQINLEKSLALYFPVLGRDSTTVLNIVASDDENASRKLDQMDINVDHIFEAGEYGFLTSNMNGFLRALQSRRVRERLNIFEYLVSTNEINPYEMDYGGHKDTEDLSRMMDARVQEFDVQNLKRSSIADQIASILTDPLWEIESDEHKGGAIVGFYGEIIEKVTGNMPTKKSVRGKLLRIRGIVANRLKAMINTETVDFTEYAMVEKMSGAHGLFDGQPIPRNPSEYAHAMARQLEVLLAVAENVGDNIGRQEVLDSFGKVYIKARDEFVSDMVGADLISSTGEIITGPSGEIMRKAHHDLAIIVATRAADEIFNS